MIGREEREAKKASAKKLSERYKKQVVRLYLKPNDTWACLFHDDPVESLEGTPVELVASYKGGVEV